MANTDTTPRPFIRAASILIEDDRICLVKQEVTGTRHWALPGGKLEPGETLSECITREFEEETGLEVRVRELLYVTDRIITEPFAHLVHMSFLVERTGGGELPPEWKHTDPHPPASADITRDVRMVPIDRLGEYGFPPAFCNMVKEDFPGRGSYLGDFHKVYGE